MPRRSAERALELKLETEELVLRIRAAIDDPSLTERKATALLGDLLPSMERLLATEERLVVAIDEAAARVAAVDVERERYERTFRFAPDAYLVTDTTGVILEANAEAEHLFGTTDRHLAGRRLDTYFADGDRWIVEGAFAHLTDHDTLAPFEAVVEPEGRSRTVDVHLGADDSSVHGTRVIRWLVRDVTERRALAREMIQLHIDIGLLARLAEVNRRVTSDDEAADSVLDSLIELATGGDPRVRAGIMLSDARGRITARAVSDADADELCRLQIAHGGPAVEALHRGEREVRSSGDLAEWPELAAEVRRLGFDWVISQPIAADGPGRGIFNLYGSGSSMPAERAMALLADHAGAAIGNRELYLTTRRVIGHLETALESRAVIEQAKGILMAREGCGADVAFDILRRASQRENRKLHEVAATLVDGASCRGGGPSAP